MNKDDLTRLATNDSIQTQPSSNGVAAAVVLVAIAILIVTTGILLWAFTGGLP
jgi:hypothetical protein